jgi:hypothetical protein
MDGRREYEDGGDDIDLSVDKKDRNKNKSRMVMGALSSWVWADVRMTQCMSSDGSGVLKYDVDLALVWCYRC